MGRPGFGPSGPEALRPTPPGGEPFVGRRAELACLRSAWLEVLRGDARLVWVEGEPGIGKSALLRRFLAQAPAARVAWATGEQGEAMLRFGALDLLELGGPEAGSERDPLAVGEGLCAELGRRTAAGPLAVVLDDAHWADAASLRALLYAARHGRRRPVLWVLTSRSGVPVPDDDGWRRQLVEGGVRLRLGGLSGEELRILAAALGPVRLTPWGAERLRRLTLGNPRDAREVLALDAEALNDPGAEPPVPPRWLREAEARLAGWPPGVVRFVQAAAVLGDAATVGRAARVAAVEDGWQTAAAAAGVLRAVPGVASERLVFPQPLLAAAFLATLPLDERRALHRRAAEDLEGVQALAHRAAGSLGPDPPLAAELRQAALAARDAGPEVSVRLARAAGALGGDHAARERAFLLSVLLLLRGGDDEAAQGHRPAVSACLPGPLRDLVLGALDLVGGDPAGAEALLARALRDGEAADDRVVVAAAAACLVRLRIARGAAVDGLPPLVEAALGASTVLPAVRLHVAAMWLWRLGGLRPAAPELAAVEAALSRHPVGGTPAEGHLLRGLWAAARYEAAAAARELAAALSAVGPHAPGRPAVARGWLAAAAFAAGRWDEAQAWAGEVAGRPAVADPLGAAGPAHALLARLHAARAARWQAEAHVQGAMARWPPWLDREALDLAQAELACLRGRWAEARDLLAGHGEAEALVLSGEASLRMGALAETRAALERAEGLAAEGAGTSWLAAAVARLRAELLEATGHPGAALETLVGWRWQPEDGFGLPALRLHALRGRLLRRAGRPEEAEAALRAAESGLGRLGAAAYLPAVERELQALLGRTPGCAVALHRLTAREREVAALAAAGCTNREIGERLHVSVKAVEYHVTRVLAKLGVASRRDLARLLPPGTGPA